MLRTSDFTKAILLDLAWFEASSQGGLVCMKMVAQCVANRVRLGWGTWSQVLSTVHDPRNHARPYALLSDMMMTWAHPDSGDPRFTAMLSAIDGIYDNTAEDLVKGGIYWADVAAPTTQQFQTTIIANSKEHPRCGCSGTFCTWS